MNPNNMSEHEQIKYVQENYINIRDINNPSELVQLEAVKKYGFCIKIIFDKIGKNPSENIQKASLDEDFHSIRWIIEPSLKFQKICINQKFYILFKKEILDNNFFIRKPKYKHLMKWID